MPTTDEWIAQLKAWEEQRNEIVKKYLDGMKAPEIARELGKSESWVYRVIRKELGNAKN